MSCIDLEHCFSSKLELEIVIPKERCFKTF
jgi:hypothetical protein